MVDAARNKTSSRGFVWRIGAALVSPRRALIEADGPANAGQAPTDITILIALLFVAFNLGSLVTIGYLLVGGDFLGGVQSLVARLAHDVQKPLLLLLGGFVAITLFAGSRRRPGSDSDLACVAFVSVIAWASGLAALRVVGTHVGFSIGAQFTQWVSALAIISYVAIVIIAISVARGRPKEDS